MAGDVEVVGGFLGGVGLGFCFCCRFCFRGGRSEEAEEGGGH